MAQESESVSSEEVKDVRPKLMSKPILTQSTTKEGSNEMNEAEGNEKENSKEKQKVSFATSVDFGDGDKDAKVIENIRFEDANPQESDAKGGLSNEVEENNKITKKTKKVNLFQVHGQKMKKKKVKMTKTISKTSNTMRKAGASLGKDIKAAKWFAVVLFCFCVCWLPLHANNCFTIFTELGCFECLPFFILLSHLNSAFNPVLYALGNSKFAAAFKRILGIKTKNQILDADQSTAY